MIDIGEMLPDAISLDDMFQAFSDVLTWLAIPLLVMAGAAIMPWVAASMSKVVHALTGMGGGGFSVGKVDRTVVMDKRSPLEQGYFEGSNDMADQYEEEQYAAGYENAVTDKMGVV